MAKRKRQQPEVHPEELVGDGSETPDKRRFRLANWSRGKTAPAEDLPPEEVADVAVVTDEQEAVEEGKAPSEEDGTAAGEESRAESEAPAENDDAADAGQPGARASRRSGNPAKSGRFQSSSQDSAGEAESPRVAVEDEVHEERLRRVAEEMTASIDNRSVTPTWYKALMLGLMIVGLLWIIVWYITQSALPIPQIGYGNIGVGIGLMMVGLIMTTRWK